jgi:hypothetical protein
LVHAIHNDAHVLLGAFACELTASIIGVTLRPLKKEVFWALLPEFVALLLGLGDTQRLLVLCACRTLRKWHPLAIPNVEVFASLVVAPLAKALRTNNLEIVSVFHLL